MTHQQRQEVMKKNPRRSRTLNCRCRYKNLLSQRKNFSPNFARESGPTDQRQNDRNSKINLKRRPVSRQRRRKSHPKRNRRKRLEDFDQPLNSVIDPAAEESGNRSNDEPNSKTENYADKSDRQRNSRSI